MMRCHDDTSGWSRVAYGVDDGAGRSIVVRGERVHGATRLSRVASPDDDPRRIAELANGVPCVAALGARAGFIRLLAAPFAHRSRARKVFPTLLDLELPFPLESCVYEFLESRGADAGAAGCTALAVGARHEDMERRIGECKARGADPVRVEHEGLALWSQALREFPVAEGGDPAIRAVVCAGPGDGALVLGEKGVPRSAHAVRPGHLETDINRLMRAHHIPGTPVDWIWCGAADWAAAEKLLTALWPGPSRTPTEPEAFLARGLAQSFLAPGPWNRNLRTGDLLHPAAMAKRLRRQIGAGVVVLCAGLALLTCAWSASRATRSAEARMDDAIAAAASGAAGYPVVARGAYAHTVARQAAEERREILKPFLDAQSPGASDRLAILMYEAAARDLRYGAIVLDGDTFSVVGDAGAWDAPERLAERLKAVGMAARVDRREARRNDGRIPFSLTQER